MLLTTFFLLAVLGQARSISPRQFLPSGAVTVNGTITSFSVLEGSGCPAGTYEPQPIEPGKSETTYADFSSFVYNSNTSPGPVTCTLSIDFEFKYPESGAAIIFVGTIGYIEGFYEEGDDKKETVFTLDHYTTASAGAETVEGGIYYTSLIDGPAELGIATEMYPTGVAGETGLGSLKMDFNARTDLGPGEMIVHRILIGFLHRHEDPAINGDSRLLKTIT
ncbi:hypothetical protein BKA66DRAFT_446539 [Pyrenochaeta sp. MPI-SDFR-AT-0127]|nr:hypothetical protein BKA66DRAFT_446539 [Pyrenochaeta sp. MPI-SDFR-AT-0127]